MPQGPGGAGGENHPGVQASFINAVMEAKGFKTYNAAKDWVYHWFNQGFTIQQIANKAGIKLPSDPKGDPPPDFTDGDGGSGGGSGGSGAAGPDPAALRAGYLGILHAWGLPSGPLAGLVNQAVGGAWSSSQFLQHLRLTKAYKEAFKGINSQPGLSESSYLAMFRQYKAKAQDIGIGLSRQQFGTLLKKGVDYQEWSFRVKAEEQIRKNANLWDWYEKELKKRGELKPKEHLTRDDLKKIVTKQNSARFEQVYQTAYMLSGLQKAGFDLFKGKKGGTGIDLTRKQLVRLIRQFEGGTIGAEVENFKAEDFAELANAIESTIPASKLYGMGVTKRDLLELKLGGPRAREIASRVGTIQASENLKQEQKADHQLVQGEKKTTLLGTAGLEGQGY